MDANRDLGSELLKQNGAGGGPPPGLPSAAVEQVVAQSRRQVRLWGWLTIVLWLAIPLEALISRVLMTLYAIYVFPRHAAEGGQGGSNTMLVVSSILSMIWPLLLCAAALCTVKFILVSRQATLRQIQAELAGISAELRRLASRER